MISPGSTNIGPIRTSVCTKPTATRASSLPRMSVVGWIVVKIISVTRFSFSSTVMFSI